MSVNIKGVWKFNEAIEDPPFVHLYAPFRSNGNRYNSFDTTVNSVTKELVGFQYCIDADATDAYLFVDYNGLTQGWQDEAYRFVDFGSKGWFISEEEHDWIVASMTYIGESDPHPVYMDIDGVRKRVTAYMDIDGIRTKVSIAG